jgi:two-component system chemotaxis sensor kinase CheA
MSLDVGRFHQIFFDEAIDHLATLEALALKLDPALPQAADLDAIFRAAHSIKGGAATFGFERLAQLTHALETVLDQVRKHTRPVTSELVSLLLSATDCLRAQVVALKSGQPHDGEAQALLLQRLHAASDAGAPAQRDDDTPAAPQNADRPSDVAITVLLEPSERGSAAALQSIEKELAALGEVQVLTPFSELQTASAIRISLCSKIPASEVKESLAFVWNENRFRVEEETPMPAPAAAARQEALSALEGDDLGFFVENLPDALAARSGSDDLEKTGRRAYDFGAEAAKFGRRQADRYVAMPMDTQSIRVGVEKVDRLVNLVGELVIAQAMLVQSATQAGAELSERVANNMGQLDRNIRELHEAVMSIRMLPIRYVFSRFPRVVRDLADKLGKKVDLIIEGEETELDKGLIEKVTDPLTHLVRNSVDHGIELPAERETAGKPAIGVLRVRALHESGNVVIEVSDDGGGFDRSRLLVKAREQGIVVSDSATDEEIWQLAFLPGLSTAKQVTEVSGRGVGMDVVKRNVEQLGGRLSLRSAAGQGTTVTIHLPLTLAIVDGMLISVGAHTYVIPLAHILENLQPRADAVRTVTGQGRVVRVRDEFIPLIALHEALNIEARHRNAHEAMLVLCESNGQRAAFQVDELLGQGQFVVKSLEQNFRRIAGVAGATILGDGRVALILDVGTLLRTGQRAVPTMTLPQ